MNSKTIYLLSMFTLLTYIQAEIDYSYSDWSYSDTNLWNTEFKDNCGGQGQSPVNVYKGEVAKNDSLQPFTMTNYDTTADQPYLLENNGHSAKVTVMGWKTPTISGGGLSTDYKLLQFHFHWGSNDNQGSEHTIGGKKYPMELHLVHMKSGIREIEALNTYDGLAILGFMFEVTDTDNANYNSLVSALSSVKEKGDQVNITVTSMNTFLPTTKSNFYRYHGSLTTPYCNEAVIWSVFTDPISISKTQLAEFRKLQTAKSNDLVNNYRLPQPLNGRKLTSNFDVDYHWGYEHEDEWSPNYESCGRSSQSPVNIPTNFAEYDEKYGAITFNNYTATTGVTMEITNNGHTVKVSVTTSEDISIEGGGLPTKYKIAQFHFHWGANNNKGSEHTIDSKQYPMEIHFVHYNASKASISDALTEHQGLAILGFMFEIDDEDNTALEPIIDKFANITNPNDKEAIHFVLSSILPSNTNDFYRYSGSLTTPPCYESVVWTVFKDAISISETQLSKFRQLWSAEKDDNDNFLLMMDNFRDIQKLAPRTVTRSFSVDWTDKWMSFTAMVLIGCIILVVCIAMIAVRTLYSLSSKEKEVERRSKEMIMFEDSGEKLTCSEILMREYELMIAKHPSRSQMEKEKWFQIRKIELMHEQKRSKLGVGSGSSRKSAERSSDSRSFSGSKDSRERKGS